jgi:hypothetical protein
LIFKAFFALYREGNSCILFLILLKPLHHESCVAAFLVLVVGLMKA